MSDGSKRHARHWLGKGPRVLFLHGGAQCAETWTLSCLHLKARFDCVALDLRGHGESDWCDDYSVDAHVGDVQSVITQLGWSDFHLVGMSLGGVVAGHFSARRSISPNKKINVRSLALVDVAPGVSFEDITRLREFVAADTVLSGPYGLIAEAKRLGVRQTDVELAHRYSSLTRLQGDGTWRWKRDDRQPTDYNHILENIERLNELSPRLTLPCLVVRGGRSRILSEVAARKFAARCNNARFVTVIGAGHSVQEDNPADLTQYLAAFWQTCELS